MRTVAVCVVFVVMVMSVQNVFAGPRYRIKRVSDAHLADLQTRIALNNKLKGISITMPVGGGRIDPLRIGRRRRSQSRFLDVLFNHSEEDKGDPVDFNDYESLIQRFRNLE
ncbi:hypothetical protein MTP99_006095 [Tenebrio molitor]|jgi:hypothetical protein|uniref:Insect parathyroid hormone n=1 Tax=Tenebrio molitor TaxID=7067 RepID=A0A977XDU4_TENMO|nr:hypothetical protein MTP99_006095 [Tenebrio molitor]UXO98173.1 insect parathyroid hormone [Tenebrio molitor]CAH1382165.1 unnamed protein product [Tenebrio molitor]